MCIKRRNEGTCCKFLAFCALLFVAGGIYFNLYGEEYVKNLVHNYRPDYCQQIPKLINSGKYEHKDDKSNKFFLKISSKNPTINFHNYTPQQKSFRFHLDIPNCIQLILSESSSSFGIWEKNAIPLYIDFYFFNWTNPNDLGKPNSTPNVEEVGPYRFREVIRKVNIVWNDNGTVTYKKLRNWYFDPVGTKGCLNDSITTLNVIALTAAKTTKDWSRVARLPLSAMLTSTQEVFVRKKVGELLFEGYSDTLIDFASSIPGLSSLIPFDKFGWFYKRNGSDVFDGVFNMETGWNGMNTLGEVKFWNYLNQTSFYKGDCGKVVGSAGDFWPPERNYTEDIVLFSPDMCRYINFECLGKTSIRNIKGYKYSSNVKLFDNGTLYPENKCLCKGSCYPSGVVDVSGCRFGAPAFVSYPHFHLADPYYLQNIQGLAPDPVKHDMYIILEQTFGIPLEVAIRLQINILLEPDPGIRMYKDISRTFFPVLWFEQKVTMTEDWTSKISLLLELFSYIKVVSYVFFTLALLTLIYLLLPYFF